MQKSLIPPSIQQHTQEASKAGETINAMIIATMVLLSVALNFFQTSRSQRAIVSSLKFLLTLSAGGSP